MKVLITGATGLVGKAIVGLLQEKEIPVHYLTTSKQKISSKEGYTGFFWNPKKNIIDNNAFEGVTHIINLAGTTISKRWTPSNKKKILTSRINSLKTLREGLVAYGAEKIKGFVSASAIGIYPSSLTSLYVENEKEVDDSFLGDVVVAWEQEIASFEHFNFNVAAIRIGLVLAENGGALPQMAKPVKNYVGAPIGTGEQWQSWIHLEDLARIFVFALNNELNGTYNGVAPNPVTNSKLTKQLAKTLQKPLWLPNVPKFILKLILGEMAYLLFASQRVSSKKIEDAGFNFYYTNICSALDKIYKPETNKIESLGAYENTYS